MQPNSSNLLYYYEEGLKLIQNGRNFFNNHIEKEDRQKGYQVYLKGIDFLIKYAKTEGNADLVAKVKKDLSILLDEAKSMNTIMNKNDSIQETSTTKCETEKTLKPETIEQNKREKDKHIIESKFLKECYPDAQDSLLEIIGALENEMARPNFNIGFEGIIGFECFRQMVREHIELPSLYPNIFSDQLQRMQVGQMLIIGPYDIDKILFAQLLAHKMKANLFKMSASDLVSKWLPHLNVLIKVLFEMAVFYAPTVIYFDGLDVFNPNWDPVIDSSLRAGYDELMNHIRELNKNLELLKQGKIVIFVGAVVSPSNLQKTPRRYFVNKIDMLLPNDNERKELIEVCLKDKIVSTDFDRTSAVNRTQGYMRSEIIDIFQEAMMDSERRKLSSQLDKLEKGALSSVDLCINNKDFTNALRKIKRTGSQEYKGYY